VREVEFFLCSLDILLLVVFFFFFFQAEDGIRDLIVTGVQTCALPISANRSGARSRAPPAGRGPAGRAPRGPTAPGAWSRSAAPPEVSCPRPTRLGEIGRAHV